MYFHSVIDTIYKQVMSNLHTHTLSVSFGDVKFLAQRGRKKGGGRYGVNMNHMITLESLECIFLTCILPPILFILDGTPSWRW